MPQALWDLAAPAKLNLFLQVVGRRADGYHQLQSVFMPIAWCDWVHLEARRDGRLQRHDLGAALPADDLALRAARRLQQASGTALGADIHLDKRLPWGAGLGGGSSDAATVLLGLNQLWGLRWPVARLAGLALELGADVPFFLAGGPAWVEGIGERLTPINRPAGRWIVIKPPASVPTPVIFSSPILDRSAHPATLADFLADPARFAFNALQAPAEAHCGEITEALRRLARSGLAARMTGSGSAVFAELGSDTSDAQAQALIQALPPGWTGWQGQGLSTHPLAGWAG